MKTVWEKQVLVLLMLCALPMGFACGSVDDPDAAGGDPGGEGDCGPDSLRGRTFIATEITQDGAPYELLAGTELSFTMRDSGDLFGNAGCNNIWGDYSALDGVLRVDEPTMGGDECDEAFQAQDNWMMAVLESEPAIQIRCDGFTITASAAGIETEIVFLDKVIVTPDQVALTDGPWMVIGRRDPMLAFTGPDRGLMEFKTDGTLSFYTACNDGSAAYEISGPAGGQILLSGTTVDEAGCFGQEAQDQETTMLNIVFAGVPVHWDINADVLTLAVGGSYGDGIFYILYLEPYSPPENPDLICCICSCGPSHPTSPNDGYTVNYSMENVECRDQCSQGNACEGASIGTGYEEILCP